jgi:integrase
MAKDKTTLRFWLRTDRSNADGSAPVHLVYQIQGQRKYYAVPGTKLFPANWNPADQQAIYIDKKAAKKLAAGIAYDLLLTNTEAAEINAKLERVCSDIADVETRFKLDKKTFSPQMVIDALKEVRQPETKKDKPGVNVIAFILQFVKDSTGTHKPGTLKVYSGLAAHLSAFEKYRNIKITFDSIDIPVLRSFNGFLTDVQKMNNVTAAKQMSTLKTLLNYARTIYKIEVNPDYRDFKVSRKDGEFEVITLTQEEFMAIYNLDLSDNKRLDAIRDVFCFSCATGLRYSDLEQLRREHIRKDNTIRMTASKTGQKTVIPLNPISYSILLKYKERLKPLPIISNQKTNDYIKEIGELAGIDTPIEIVRMRGVKKITEVFKKYELLSIHIGRKSFITLSLEKGIAIQEVMSLSGHTTFKAFKRYVDVNDSRKKTVMADAWGKIDVTNKLKAV